MEDKTVFYMHAGSGNHGCEAIVNSTCHMLDSRVTVISARKAEDEKYSLAGLCSLLAEKKITEKLWVHLYYFAKKVITRNPMCYIKYRFQEILKKGQYKTAVSIGGDNYCYPDQVEDLMLLNRAFNEQGAKTVLWGASVEPALLKREAVTEDMKRYSHIFAREKITYEALRQAGIEKERLHLYPDPAFALETEEVTLPSGFVKGNMAGINISPMIAGNESIPGMVMENYRRLLRFILDTTDMQIALLPHVVWKSNDDRELLLQLYEEFEDSGRVIMIEDCSCTELKGYIAAMRFLVTARTHASIAAYSSKVPALVAGYSVKAEGIAEDLFGTWENYVVPVQKLSEADELAKAFAWFLENEERIKAQLEETIPGYIELAKEGGRRLNKILKE